VPAERNSLTAFYSSLDNAQAALPTWDVPAFKRCPCLGWTGIQCNNIYSSYSVGTM
jgi:hypothetical protein